MYYEVADVVCEGALEETATFTDYLVMGSWIDDIRREAESHGYLVQIFVTPHDHPMDGRECQCGEYLTDHKPMYEFNATEQAS